MFARVLPPALSILVRPLHIVLLVWFQHVSRLIRHDVISRGRSTPQDRPIMSDGRFLEAYGMYMYGSPWVRLLSTRTVAEVFMPRWAKPAGGIR